jgi:hypothetical protein
MNTEVAVLFWTRKVVNWQPLSCCAMKNSPPLMMVKGQGTAVCVRPSGQAGVPGLGPGVSSDVTLQQAFRKTVGQIIAAEASNKRAYLGDSK